MNVMSLSSTLYSIQNTISSRSNEVNEKIERLQKAKSEISSEQSILLQEIEKIKQPDLGKDWTGKRSEEFDEEREQAYTIMKNIGQYSYNSYQYTIESKINVLELERMALNTASALAHEAGDLVNMGEDAIDELSDRISDLKRRLF